MQMLERGAQGVKPVLQLSGLRWRPGYDGAAVCGFVQLYYIVQPGPMRRPVCVG